MSAVDSANDALDCRGEVFGTDHGGNQSRVVSLNGAEGVTEQSHPHSPMTTQGCRQRRRQAAIGKIAAAVSRELEMGRLVGRD